MSSTTLLRTNAEYNVYYGIIRRSHAFGNDTRLYHRNNTVSYSLSLSRTISRCKRIIVQSSSRRLDVRIVFVRLCTNFRLTNAQRSYSCVRTHEYVMAYRLLRVVRTAIISCAPALVCFAENPTDSGRITRDPKSCFDEFWRALEIQMRNVFCRGTRYFDPTNLLRFYRRVRTRAFNSVCSRPNEIYLFFSVILIWRHIIIIACLRSYILLQHVHVVIWCMVCSLYDSI